MVSTDLLGCFMTAAWLKRFHLNVCKISHLYAKPISRKFNKKICNFNVPSLMLNMEKFIHFGFSNWTCASNWTS